MTPSDQYIQSYQSENIGDQMNFRTALHKEITTRIMTNPTSWKDRSVFENSSISPAFKGLNATTQQNQRNQFYQS